MPLTDTDVIDELAILKEAVAGQPDAFAELFRRYHPMIYAFAYRLCLHQADAQDIAQETFIKRILIRRVPSFSSLTRSAHAPEHPCAKLERLLAVSHSAAKVYYTTSC